MDRASGSGVFARDPDALLDLIELELPESLLTQEKNKAVCSVCYDALCEHGFDDRISQDDMCSQSALLELCRSSFDAETYKKVAMQATKNAERAENSRSAWRIEGTLREFPKFPPVNVWFDYPIHQIDRVGVLKDVEAEAEQPPWKKAMSKRKPKEVKERERKVSVDTAFEACGIDGKVTLYALAEYMGVTQKTVRNRLKEHGGYWIEEGNVGKKEGK